MAHPLETASGGADFTAILNSLMGLKEEELLESMRLAAVSKKGNLKIGFQAQNSTRKNRAMTIRLLPDVHKKFMEVGQELLKEKGPIPNEIKRRASTTFTAALTKGEVIIELKKDGKRSAFASPEMAQKLKDHKLELSDGHGKTKSYDGVVVVELKSFQQLADAFVKNLQNPQQPQKQTTAEVIKATQTEQSAPPAAPAIVVQTPEKKVSLGQPKEEAAPASKPDLLKKQDAALEAERRELSDKQEKQKEVLEQAQEIKEEETTKADVKLQETLQEAKTELPPTLPTDAEPAPQPLPQALPSALPEKTK